MTPHIFVFDENSPDINAIRECADIIRSGGIVIFPTETVYGIGVNALDQNAVKRLYAAKQRPLDKPLLCHITGIEQAKKFAYIDDRAKKVIDAFTPGPLTLVVKKRSLIPDIVTSGSDTVGLRFPSNNLFKLLSMECDLPIAATSANISGNVSAKDSQDLKNVYGIADAVIDCGKCQYSLESTILSLVDEPKLIRQGAFSKEQLEEVLRSCF